MTITADQPTIEGRGRRRAPLLRWVAIVVALSLLVGWALVAARGLSRDPRFVRSPLLGRPTPAFSLPVIGGGTFASADFAGSVLVVNFWASWCVPCQEEAAELESFSKRWSGRNVSLVGIVYNDKEKAATKFRDSFGLTYPQVMDPNGRTALDFGVYGVPETYVIDRDGTIKAKLVGAVSPGTLDQVVAAVQQGKMVTTANKRYRTSSGG